MEQFHFLLMTKQPLAQAKLAELLQISMKEPDNRIVIWLRVNKIRIDMAKFNFIIFSRLLD